MKTDEEIKNTPIMELEPEELARAAEIANKVEVNNDNISNRTSNPES